MRTPLKHKWFHILLALADQERHGYGIQRDVLERTDGQLMLWPAMLYRSLSALSDLGLIEAVDDPGNARPDERRQYYQITLAGRNALADEAERFARWVEVARKRNGMGAPKSA